MEGLTPLWGVSEREHIESVLVTLAVAPGHGATEHMV